MKFLIALTAILVVTSAAYDHSLTINNILDNFMDGSVKDLFKVWHLLFEKEYTLDSDIARQRFRNFKAKVAEIKAFNAENRSFKLGLNQFSDLTFDEFSKLYLTEKVPDFKPESNFLPFEDDDDDLTSRRLGDKAPVNHSKLFNSVRDQGQCGSCWTFAAAGAVDGALAISNGSQEFTSTQQLVDCDSSNYGCNGGYYPNAFTYLIKNGANYDHDYPYRGIQETCTRPVGAPTVTVKSVEFCNDDFQITKSMCNSDKVYEIVKQGPAAVSVYVDSAFASYKKGIYTCGSCIRSNHAVVLVGYGYCQETKLFYWLIRNSWSKNWGESGHIRIQDNPKTKSCWVTNRAYRVILG